MEPIPFDHFLKIVIGVGILGLGSQMFTIFKIEGEVRHLQKKLLKLYKPITYKDERQIIKLAGSKKNTNKLLISFLCMVAFVLIYGITSNIPYLSDTQCYNKTVSIISYLAVTVPTSFILYYMYRINKYYNLVKALEKKYLDEK